MARFEFEVIKRIEIGTTVYINAKDEEEAEAKLNEKIEKGLGSKVEYTFPDGWDVFSDEIDTQLR